jgi:Zn finger protein HypA/HybF involved in hydrogenase expression
MEGNVEVRCRYCHHRFRTQTLQELVECPNCFQRWRLKWFDEATATILAPESWAEFQAKMKEVKK